jgi:hypothetical protein
VREQALGRADLVFPLLYIPVPELGNEAQWLNDPVLSIIGARQYLDWKPYLYLDTNSTTVRAVIGHFCDKIVETLRRPWISPEEHRTLLARPANELAEVSTPAEEESQQADAARSGRREREGLAGIDAEIEELVREKKELQDKLALVHFTNPVEYTNVLQYTDLLGAKIDNLRVIKTTEDQKAP